MHALTKTAFAALLLGSTMGVSAFAAAPDSTGCPPGMHRAESEGSGVGTVDLAARKADTEGSGVGTVRQAAALAPCK